jgi:hypothetical protein
MLCLSCEIIYNIKIDITLILNNSPRQSVKVRYIILNNLLLIEDCGFAWNLKDFFNDLLLINMLRAKNVFVSISLNSIVSELNC